MSKLLRVLIVEDSDNDAVLLVRELRRGGYDVTFERVDTPSAMHAALDSGQWDIIIADYSMPYFSAPAALTLLQQERGLDLPFIIVSGTIGEETAVSAMKAGAHDYLMKSNLARLVSTVERELREAEVRLARQQAEEALHKSEERFRLLVEGVKDYAILMINADGRVASWNIGAERILGYSEAEIIGQPFSRLFTPQDIALGQDQQELKTAVTEGWALNERWHMRQDGTQFWASGTVTALRDQQGTLQGFSKILRDRTETKLAEEALQRSEQRFRSLVEATSRIVWTNTAAGEMQGSQPAWSEFTGQSAAEYQGYGWACAVHPDDAQPTLEAWQKAVDTRSMFMFEHRLRRYDGQWRTFSVCAIPVVGPDGTTIREWVGVHTDITERKQTEEQIKAALKEKEVLLKEIHHRVKNNLQVISSLLNLQSRSIQDKQYLEIFKDSQDRIKAMALIHEKLYQAKDLARINFAGYIRDLAASLFRSYKGTSAAITLQIQIGDVSLGIDAAVPCGLIINELVSNALKYAFGMGNKGEIRIELSMNLDHQFVLIVSDNGVGFPKNLDFQNTESLGLQLVNALAAQLRGRVELNSNGGTEFKITFPT